LSLRLGIVALEPARRELIRFHSFLLVAHLLVDFSLVLLVRRCAPEVALARVVVYRDVDNACGIFGVRLAVDFEGLDERVGGIVGLGEVSGLDGCGALEC
jgi:hypothetical protein